jgi:hypothetical protein
MLPIVAIAVGLVGCVMPPDADYVQPPANQPPRIITSSSSPTPYLGVVYQGPDCLPLEQTYSVYVTDPDLGDKLYWRAFVDYEHNWPQGFASGALDNAGRELNISFAVRGDDARFGKLTDVPHMVELMVADRPFFDDDRDPRGHAIPVGALSDTIIWTVRYVATNCAQ